MSHSRRRGRRGARPATHRFVAELAVGGDHQLGPVRRMDLPQRDRSASGKLPSIPCRSTSPPSSIHGTRSWSRRRSASEVMRGPGGAARELAAAVEKRLEWSTTSRPWSAQLALAVFPCCTAQWNAAPTRSAPTRTPGCSRR